MMPDMTTQAAPPWMTDKPPTSLIGAAGEHYCMSQLLLRGSLAALTPRGAPDADLLVHSADGLIAAEVQVKARSGRGGRGWRMSEKHESIIRARLFYCFVDFGQERDWPVFVMPSHVVALYLRRSHQAWLAAPGRDGQQHNDWPGRFVSARRPAQGFPVGWMDQYEDRWDLIVGAVGGQPGGTADGY
jgi:hypothetical protein